MVEFYNASLDHYFITWVADEIAKLDSGQFKGWARTGQSFKVYSGAQAGTTAVCRIYIPPGKGDGHFFGRDKNECDGTMVKNPTFNLESSTFFYLIPPNLGTCAAGTVPGVPRVLESRRCQPSLYDGTAQPGTRWWPRDGRPKATGRISS